MFYFSCKNTFCFLGKNGCKNEFFSAKNNRFFIKFYHRKKLMFSC